MVLSLLAGIFLLLLLTMIARTMVLQQSKEAAPQTRRTVDEQDALGILSKAVQCKTISHQDPERTDWNEFIRLADLFAQTYPRCESHRITPDAGAYNLVYRFEGEDTQAAPALLTAHLDVVGAQEEAWLHPPFSGVIEDGYLYGRGSFDCKVQAVAILTAFESLLAQHKRPKRTFYVAFGCDEECNGSQEGACSIASWFEKQGISFAYVLDEGGVVSQRYIKGFDQDIAVVGVAEKGYMDVELSAASCAGHSSTPSFPTALGLVCQAVQSLERRTMPARLTVPVRAMLDSLGRQAKFPFRLLFLNLWITKPMLLGIFSRSPTLNALIRTTVVPTMIEASDKSNVIAEQAKAMVNVRLLPGQTPDDVLAWMEKVIRNPKVKLKAVRFTPASEVSPAKGEAFDHLEKTITACFDHVLVTPYLMLGATDARKYQKLSKHIYRFTPVRMARSEVERMHGVDERISEQNIRLAATFYATLIEG